MNCAFAGPCVVCANGVFGCFVPPATAFCVPAGGGGGADCVVVVVGVNGACVQPVCAGLVLPMPLFASHS